MPKKSRLPLQIGANKLRVLPKPKNNVKKTQPSEEFVKSIVNKPDFVDLFYRAIFCYKIISPPHKESILEHYICKLTDTFKTVGQSDVYFTDAFIKFLKNSLLSCSQTDIDKQYAEHYRATCRANAKLDFNVYDLFIALLLQDFTSEQDRLLPQNNLASEHVFYELKSKIIELNYFPKKAISLDRYLLTMGIGQDSKAKMILFGLISALPLFLLSILVHPLFKHLIILALLPALYRAITSNMQTEALKKSLAKMTTLEVYHTPEDDLLIKIVTKVHSSPIKNNNFFSNVRVPPRDNRVNDSSENQKILKKIAKANKLATEEKKQRKAAENIKPVPAEPECLNLPSVKPSAGVLKIGGRDFYLFMNNDKPCYAYFPEELKKSKIVAPLWDQTEKFLKGQFAVVGNNKSANGFKAHHEQEKEYFHARVNSISCRYIVEPIKIDGYENLFVYTQAYSKRANANISIDLNTISRARKLMREKVEKEIQDAVDKEVEEASASNDLSHSFK